jgi:hypothetical protein
MTSELRTTYLGTLGIAAFFLAAAVAVVACGAVDERIAPLWNPAVLAAASLGPAYAAPRAPLRALFAGGLGLGLFYGAMVFLASTLTGSANLLGPERLFAWAGAIGAIPPTAAGAFYRWLARRTRHTAP